MIICFTGHRDCLANPYQLAGIQLDYPEAKWIHGGAKDGFDKQVQEHIERNQIEHEVYPPEYDKYPPHSAPIMRNQKMIDLKPDLLVALWDGRTHGGTFRTIKYAKEKGVEIKYLTIDKRLPSKKIKVL